MKSYRLLLFIVSSFFLTTTRAQMAPQAAEDILKEAYQLAAKENKKVFVMFHASWCGWCHKMDSSLLDKSCKKFFDDNYVIRHLVVYESKGKENLQNPGAVEFLTKYHGNDTGIPYWLIFDKEGSLLADSKLRAPGASLNDPGENTGCPASAKEVANFIEVLKKTSRLNADQLAVIEKRFRQNEH